MAKQPSVRLVHEKVSRDLGSGFVEVKNKILTIISIIVVIIILFLARTIYSDHNLKKIISACILDQTQTSNLEEAKQICVDKFK